MSELKRADLVVPLLRESGVLLCADLCCPSTTTDLAPGQTAGWMLVRGWWYCPQHIPPTGPL